MPRKSPYVLNLTPDQRRELELRARRYTLPYRDVVRAKIVLMAAEGIDNDEIAARLDTRREIVSKWRKRFFEQGLAGSRSAPGAADRRSFPPEVVVAAKALACELPSRLAVPLSRLHIPDIAAEVRARGIVAEVSGTTIWRLAVRGRHPAVAAAVVDLPSGPQFETNAGRVLDLYARSWQGKPLGEGDFVISADEKTSIQARIRCHPTLGPASGRTAGSSTSTNGAGRWPTWPPGTCTGPRSWAAASPPPGSPPSPGWSSR